jgi:N-acetylneuraminate synthase
METLTVGTRTIGPDSPVYIIAEAGINHNGDLQTAKELVDAAVDAGADAVKFQKRSLKQTYIEDLVDDPSTEQLQIEYTLSNLKDVTLSDEKFKKLAEYTLEQGITFLCTPWDHKSIDFLESISVPAYKIGSPDMTNFVLLEHIIETGKPLMISTGMATDEEVDRTIRFLQERNAVFAVLHCQSTYPAPFHNINLRYMETLMERYDVPVGYSGHERGIAVTEAAVGIGATIVERHLTLDRSMEGLDHNASLEPAELDRLITDIRNIETALGNDVKYLTRGEYNNRLALGKSLVTTQPIEQGTTITREQISAKSPGRGISPQHLYDVVGTQTRTKLTEDTILHWNHLQEEMVPTYDKGLDNWGVVVRFSDVTDTDWGDPDLYEFRVNGADLDVDIGAHLADSTFDKQLGVHAPIKKGHDLVDLSSPEENERRDAVEIIQQTIDLTRDVIAPKFESGTPKIVIHPGGIRSDGRDTDRIPEFNRSLERSMNELDDSGVELLLENIPPLPWMWGGQHYHNNFLDADEIAAFCERTGQKLCYDTSHAQLWCNYNGTDLEEHASTLAPYVEYLHVSDAAGIDGEGLQIGEGEIDFEQLFTIFDDFDGPIITEIWRGHERNGYGFKKAAARLSEYV